MAILFETYEEDGVTPTFFETAREHEVVFRGVLAHIKSIHQEQLKDTDVDAPLDELLNDLSPYRAYGRFAIGDFVVGQQRDSAIINLADGIAENEALISFGNMATLSGFAAIFRYDIDDEQKPTFSKSELQMRA